MFIYQSCYRFKKHVKKKNKKNPNNDIYYSLPLQGHEKSGQNGKGHKQNNLQTRQLE